MLYLEGFCYLISLFFWNRRGDEVVLIGGSLHLHCSLGHDSRTHEGVVTAL